MTTLKKSFHHIIPADLKCELLLSEKLVNVWNSLTPLARNEWICWIISVKKEETRQKHIDRLKEEILNGKRRPCCFAGCPHRTGKM